MPTSTTALAATHSQQHALAARLRAPCVPFVPRRVAAPFLLPSQQAGSRLKSTLLARGQAQQGSSFDDEAAGLWQQPTVAATPPESAWEGEAKQAAPAQQAPSKRTPSPSTPPAPHHHHSPFNNISWHPDSGSSSSSSASPPPVEDHSISSTPPALPASIRRLTNRAPLYADSDRPEGASTTHPDSYDASSDDEALMPPMSTFRSGSSSRRGKGGSKGRGVKAHSGLEAQDAADYERRLDQQEARDAMVGVSRSGMSSDDEDSGGLDYSAVIARQTELATQARKNRYKPRRRQPDAAAPQGNAAASSSSTSSQEGSGSSGSDSDEAMGGAGKASAAVALAAELLLSGGSGEDEQTEAEEQPNRFMGVPLEPPGAESVALAAELLAAEEEQRRQRRRQGASSLEGLLGAAEVVPSSSSAVDAAAAARGGAVGARAAEVGEGPLVRVTLPPAEVYERAESLEVTLGLPTSASAASASKQRGVAALAAAAAAAASATATDSEPESASDAEEREEDRQLVAAVLGPSGASELEAKGEVQLEVAKGLAAMMQRGDGGAEEGKQDGAAQ